MSNRNAHHTAIVAKLGTAGLCVDVRIVAENLTEEQAFALETKRISEYGRDFLTNMTDGGEGNANPPEHVRDVYRKLHTGNTYNIGRVLKESTRRKIGDANRGRPMPEHVKAALIAANTGSERLVGRKLSAETRQKMSRAHLGNKYAKGFVWGDEQRARASEARKGRKPHPNNIAATVTRCSKPVVCESDGRWFPSAAEAARYYGLYNHVKIAEVCRGTRKRAIGRVFAYESAV